MDKLSTGEKKRAFASSAPSPSTEQSPVKKLQEVGGSHVDTSAQGCISSGGGSSLNRFPTAGVVADALVACGLGAGVGTGATGDGEIDNSSDDGSTTASESVVGGKSMWLKPPETGRKLPRVGSDYQVDITEIELP
jgi:hypothetical protein